MISTVFEKLFPRFYSSAAKKHERGRASHGNNWQTLNAFEEARGEQEDSFNYTRHPMYDKKPILRFFAEIAAIIIWYGSEEK